MKVTSKLWIAVLEITGTFFTSCQKDQDVPVQVNTVQAEAPQEKSSLDALRAAYPTIEKGRLHFNSQADFKTYMGLIGQYDIADIEALNQEKGFRSHFAKTHQAEDTNTANAGGGGGDKEESAKWDIPDPYFAETLDENREISFGNGVVCRAGNDFSFIFPAGQQGLIDAFCQDYARGGVTIPEDGTYIGNLFVYPTAIEAPNVGGTKVRDIFKSRVRDNMPFAGSDYRLYGEMWQGNWFVYASSGTKSECNKTRTIFWITYYTYTNAAKLGVSWNVTMATEIDGSCNPVPLAFVTNQQGALNGVNVSTMTKRLEWQTGQIGIIGVVGYQAKLLNKIVKGSTSTHTGTLNGNKQSLTLTWKC